ncbi:MAG: glycosyltransferase, partial [Sphingomonadaceae bacterium]|nr:glycosyltransferase [Sphingomonadaceae bacterium]
GGSRKNCPMSGVIRQGSVGGEAQKPGKDSKKPQPPRATRKMLTKRFPDTVFLGALSGAELASTYAAADVFVFPSLTDTFGLVVIEALACGIPVAAFPVGQALANSSPLCLKHWSAAVAPYWRQSNACHSCVTSVSAQRHISPVNWALEGKGRCSTAW